MGINLPTDLYIINNEINKLLLKDKNIDSDNIDIFLSKYNKIHFLALSNAIVAGDNSEIIESYIQQIQNNCEPLLIISQLASNYEASYLIKLYKEIGWRNIDISAATSINIYRINKLESIIENDSIYNIGLLINELAILDESIKDGTLDKRIGLDKFIFHIIKRNSK